MTEAQRRGTAIHRSIEIKLELKRINEEIDALYWAFTRQARAKPPVVVRPDLYRRRAELEDELSLLPRVEFP